MNETQLTIVGNLVDAPELRFTPAGKAVARFRIASTPRYRDNATGEWKDGDTLFLTCQVWRQAAENVLLNPINKIGVLRIRPKTFEWENGASRRHAAKGKHGDTVV